MDVNTEKDLSPPSKTLKVKPELQGNGLDQGCATFTMQGAILDVN